MTALAEAAKVGSEVLCRRIMQYQVQKQRLGETPLMLASKAGHEQVVRMLLVAGAQDINGHTALMHAAATGGKFQPLTLAAILQWSRLIPLQL